MVDIAMCSNRDCNRRHHCFRYLATPTMEMQSYIQIEDTDNCEMYWQCRNRKELEYFNKENEF